MVIKRNRFEKLTHMQLQQLLIHLESELFHCRSVNETKERNYHEQLNRLKQDNSHLRSQLQKIINENEMFNQERDTLIFQYNEAVQKSMTSKELTELTEKNQRYESELQVLKEKMEQITKKNVSYQQKFTQLETDKEAALSLVDRQQAELSNLKAQLVELENVKGKILNQLKHKLKEVRRLEDENHRLIKENAAARDRITSLEGENHSLHDKFRDLSFKREADEKRLNNTISNLNEVFTQTKTIIKTASSLQNQLEVKNFEIKQVKKENEKLMEEIKKLHDDFERSEAKRTELENQIDNMKTELLKAQDSLVRLELFETEKLKLKDELEGKIEEFNNLTLNYQREKESYLQVLENVQNQVNEYKDKSERFNSEKGSWSKQIDELKIELEETKASLVKMQELEQQNEKLNAELKEKEMDFYKIQKESERTIQNLTTQFNSELKMYQEKINQYEVDKEKAELQIKEMNAKLTGLESSLREKENFIRLYITQPPAPTVSKIADQPSVETIHYDSEQLLPAETKPSFPQGQQSADWFQRNLSQQQGVYQNVQNSTKANTAALDFFTLRSKTTLPTSPGAVN